jgi:hypothetical protein
MANKAPPPGNTKKPGRSVKEKRAAKQEKKDAQARDRKAWSQGK